MIKKSFFSVAFLFSLGVLLWALPPPSGVTPKAWHLFAVFAATIVGIILKPFPMGVIALLGLTISVTSQLLSFEDAFSGFSNEVVWLVVFAFFISKGFIQSGLGSRIAYLLMRAIGKKSLGLGYGLVATDLLIAPMIPSLTARGGGVIYPLLKSIAEIFSGTSHDPKMRSFLTLAAFQGTAITSAMFLTSMAGNPLIAQFAANLGISISWQSWAVAAFLPALISLAVVPYLIYRIIKPTIRNTPHAKELAQMKLKEMGPMKSKEWIVLFTFSLMIFLWIFGSFWKIKAATAAMIGLMILLMTKVMSWKDLLQEESAWDTFVWFSTLITLPRFLNEFGFTSWFSNWIVTHVTGSHWLVGFLLLVFIYFYSHYLFASNVGHITAMYVAFLIVAISLGTPKELAALSLGFLSSLFGGLTHYGSGPAPILFGTGYVTISDWWKVGAIVGFVNLLIWVFCGGLWWKILGLW